MSLPGLHHNVFAQFLAAAMLNQPAAYIVVSV